MNVRASWSQTLARPTYREFASYRSYDVTGDEILQGNPSLTLTHCENYDLRWEWFPHAGDVLSVGGFYKNLTAPIERIALDRLGDIVTYTNQPTATVFGIEFEARKNLRSLADWLEPVSLGVNFAWIASEIANSSAAMAEKLTTTGRAAKSRPLYDQSPYVLNADISYESKRSGTIVSVVFNQAGERLYLVNNTGYDVYEQPAPQLDFILSQKLGKAWKLKFSAKNLLDPEFKRIYGQAGELKGEFVYGSYRKGMTFGLSLSRDF
jgi:outer membrane receptor protein involved in Fe transport